ncbi:hypothetical protein [Flavobacterium sp.]|jgi:hypothetical protein|uniref:hypothetical protein n=1 Tax=Flavobacterium sp. TaxID=239 RepID=UPI0037C0A30B
MKIIIISNIVLLILACLLPNQFLAFHSYVIFGIQFLTLIPFLLSKLKYLKNFFLPSFFILLYFLINESLGSFLVTRGFGFTNWFDSYLAKIENYNLIVSYLVVCNFTIFTVCMRTLKKLNLIDSIDPKRNLRTMKFDFILDIVRIFTSIILFLLFSYFDIYSLFSFQLAIIIILCSYLSYFKKTIRFLVYLVFLILMVKFNFENKREVVISLFAMIFLEAYYSRIKLQFTFKKIVFYFFGIFLFFFLVLTSSILRGYGSFEADTFSTAATYLPDYVESDFFVDGLTDNLELNYSYGTGISAMNMIIVGDLPHQYGYTLLKLFFLPIPRDMITFKPESIMQMFTKKFYPSFWAEGGSLPVILPVDMFLNFHFLGFLATGIIIYLLDFIFMKFHQLQHRSFLYFSFIFLFSTILAFARGSGIDLYFFYYIVIIPFLLVYILGRIFFKSFLNQIIKTIK